MRLFCIVLMSHALATTLTLPVQGITQSVIVTSDGRRSLSLGAGSLQNAADIVFDDKRNTVLMLDRPRTTSLPWTVRAYEESGEMGRQWKVPETLRPITGIYEHDGQYEFIAGEFEPELQGAFQSLPPLPKRCVRVTFAPGSEALRVTPLANLWAVSDDAALNPAATAEVRRLINKLQYVSQPFAGDHVGIPRPEPEHVFVNACPLGNEPVEWNGDLSTIYFGWGSLQYSFLSRRTSDGSYQSWNLKDVIRAAIKRERLDADHIRYSSAILGRDKAVVGLSLYSGGNTSYWAVLLNLTGDQPTVTRVANGRVARTLKRFPP